MTAPIYKYDLVINVNTKTILSPEILIFNKCPNNETTLGKSSQKCVLVLSD